MNLRKRKDEFLTRVVRSISDLSFENDKTIIHLLQRNPKTLLKYEKLLILIIQNMKYYKTFLPKTLEKRGEKGNKNNNKRLLSEHERSSFVSSSSSSSTSSSNSSRKKVKPYISQQRSDSLSPNRSEGSTASDSSEDDSSDSEDSPSSFGNERTTGKRFFSKKKQTSNEVVTVPSSFSSHSSSSPNSPSSFDEMHQSPLPSPSPPPSSLSKNSIFSFWKKKETPKNHQRNNIRHSGRRNNSSSSSNHHLSNPKKSRGLNKHAQLDTTININEKQMTLGIVNIVNFQKKIRCKQNCKNGMLLVLKCHEFVLSNIQRIVESFMGEVVDFQGDHFIIGFNTMNVVMTHSLQACQAALKILEFFKKEEYWEPFIEENREFIQPAAFSSFNSSSSSSSNSSSSFYHQKQASKAVFPIPEVRITLIMDNIWSGFIGNSRIRRFTLLSPKMALLYGINKTYRSFSNEIILDESVYQRIKYNFETKLIDRVFKQKSSPEKCAILKNNDGEQQQQQQQKENMNKKSIHHHHHHHHHHKKNKIIKNKEGKELMKSKKSNMMCCGRLNEDEPLKLYLLIHEIKIESSEWLYEIKKELQKPTTMTLFDDDDDDDDGDDDDGNNTDSPKNSTHKSERKKKNKMTNLSQKCSLLYEKGINLCFDGEFEKANQVFERLVRIKKNKFIERQYQQDQQQETGMLYDENGKEIIPSSCFLTKEELLLERRIKEKRKEESFIFQNL